MKNTRLKPFYLLFIAVLLIILIVNIVPQIKKDVEHKKELADVKTEVKKLYIEKGIPKRGLDADMLDVLTQRALELDGEEGHLLLEELELIEQVNLTDKWWSEINKKGTIPNAHSIDIYTFKESVEELPEMNQAQFSVELKAFEDREKRLEKLFEKKKQQYAHEFEVVENEWLGNLNQEGPEPYEDMLKDLIENNESRVFDDVINDANYLISEFEKNNQKMLESITKNAHKSKKSNFMTQFNYYFKLENSSGLNAYVLYAYNDSNIDYKIATDFFMLKDGDTGQYTMNTGTQSKNVHKLMELNSYDGKTADGDEIGFVILKPKSDTEICRFGVVSYENAVELAYRPYEGIEFSFELKEK